MITVSIEVDRGGYATAKSYNLLNKAHLGFLIEEELDTMMAYHKVKPITGLWACYINDSKPEEFYTLGKADNRWAPIPIETMDDIDAFLGNLQTIVEGAFSC